MANLRLLELTVTKPCGRSLIEILGGHSNSGVARTQGSDFQERCPQGTQRGVGFIFMLDPCDGLLNDS
jgi:hypothetical protein